NPTRSANRTETSRRSVVCSDVTERAGGGGVPATGTAPAREDPHSPQNFIPGAFRVPHEGQATVRGRPHSPENLRRASFSNPQFEHVIVCPDPPNRPDEG